MYVYPFPSLTHFALCVAFRFAAPVVRCIYIRAPRYRYSQFIIHLIVTLFVSRAPTRPDAFETQYRLQPPGTFPRVVTLTESKNGLLSEQSRK